MSTDRPKLDESQMEIKKEPAVLDNASNARFQQDAVIDAELQNVTHTLGWLEVPGQVGRQLQVEHPHLVGRGVGHDHLRRSSQLPIAQLSRHPVSNVAGVVSSIKRSTSQD